METKRTDATMSGGTEARGMRYGHPSMSRAERAKIFMPFDALPEYRTLLRKKEEEVADRERRGLL